MLALDIGTLIESVPDLHQGSPVIAGTSVTVKRVAGYWTSVV
jgi:uncharacterized protein (DUF433 family)